MAVKKHVRIRVLLGVDGLDPDPFVIGALDEKTYDTLDDNGWYEFVQGWKRNFDARDIHHFEWRECWLTVPADRLQQVFDPKAIPAEVEA